MPITNNIKIQKASDYSKEGTFRLRIEEIECRIFRRILDIKKVAQQYETLHVIFIRNLFIKAHVTSHMDTFMLFF